jgi:ComF family protein
MWNCKLTNSSVEVFYGPNLKGEYWLLQEPYCRKCSAPEAHTDSCSWHDKCYGFDRAFAMGLYYPSRGDPASIGWNDLLSKHIRGAKMYPSYAVPLGLGLALCVNNIYKDLLKMDLIVPVPKFATELKKARNGSGRKYNQSAEMSRVISEYTQIPFVDILGKNREQKMKGLSADERWKAVKDLYETRDKEAIRQKKIILVDDVYTSGATVSECSATLLRNGAKCVNVLIAGRDTNSG